MISNQLFEYASSDIQVFIKYFVISEDRLGESVCPQTVKTEIISDGRECLFAFKRNNAKFAWPVFNR